MTSGDEYAKVTPEERANAQLCAHCHQPKSEHSKFFERCPAFTGVKKMFKPETIVDGVPEQPEEEIDEVEVEDDDEDGSSLVPDED